MNTLREPNEADIAMLNSYLSQFGITIDLESIKMLQKKEMAEQKNNGEEKQLFSIKEVSRIYGLSRWKIYRLIRSGTLRNTIKLGTAKANKVLIPKVELEKFLLSKQLKVGK